MYSRPPPLEEPFAQTLSGKRKMDVGPVGGLRKKTKTKNKTAITSPAQACPVLRELQRYRGLVLLVRDLKPPRQL